MPSLLEAQYLTAIINSRVLEQALEPLMPKGQFGARHVHKHHWRLEIPEFYADDELHQQIAKAGEAAAAGAQTAWNEAKTLRKNQNKATGVRYARNEIRQWLAQSKEGHQVENLVTQLLNPTQPGST